MNTFLDSLPTDVSNLEQREYAALFMLAKKTQKENAQFRSDCAAAVVKAECVERENARLDGERIHFANALKAIIDAPAETEDAGRLKLIAVRAYTGEALDRAQFARKPK